MLRQRSSKTALANAASCRKMIVFSSTISSKVTDAGESGRTDWAKEIP
jgi:hypothetical protein